MTVLCVVTSLNGIYSGWSRRVGLANIRLMTVERTLRYVEDRAALMRFLVDCAAESPVASEPQIFAGLGDIFEDIETMLRSARHALSVDALDCEVNANKS
jgi:hypothetical protein